MKKISNLILVIVILAAMLTCSFASGAEGGAVSAVLTAKQTGEDIDVSVEIENGLDLPIAVVGVYFQDQDGYVINGNGQEIARIDPDEKASVRALYQPGTAINPPATGDGAAIGGWVCLSILSLGALVLWSKKSLAARRMLSLLLCVACAASCLCETTAFAEGIIDLQNIPEKRDSTRGPERYQARSFTVSETLQTAENVIVISAQITYTTPSTSDNLNDNKIDLSDLYVLMSQGKISVVFSDEGAILAIDGALSDQPIRNADEAADFLNSIRELFNYDGYTSDFRMDASDLTVQSDTQESDRKMTFYRYSPKANGLDVLGSQIVLVVDQQNRMRGLTSSYDEELDDININKTVSQDEAHDTAWQELAALDVVRQMIEQAKMADPTLKEGKFLDELKKIFTITSEVIIYAASKDLPTAAVYEVHMINDIVPDDSWEYAESVDIPMMDYTCYVFANGARGGEVHSMVNNNTSVWGTALIKSTDLLGREHHLHVQTNGEGLNRLKDAERNIEIYRPEKFLGVDLLPGNMVETRGKFEKVDVSAYVNMIATYDFYKSVLGRKSYDGNGKTIVVTTEYDEMFGGKTYYNAFWSSAYQQFAIGNDGNFAAALDVVAHEYTHAVNDYIFNPIYQNESGALEESYCDIMGNLAEGKTDEGQWLVAEDSRESIRDISDPSKYNQPEHYDDRYTGKKDNGGVHKNSSIFAFATYKMRTDFRLASVDATTWAKLFYRSMYYLPSDATLLQGRIALILAAKDFGFSSMMIDAMKDAFDAVGICEFKTVRIELTWGIKPADLDAHLTGPANANGRRFHIYFAQKDVYTNGNYYKDDASKLAADLDYDDTTSFGPEIMTIHALKPGTYYYYVHDYTNRSKTNTEALSDSVATVKVYVGDSLAPSVIYKITPGQKGTVWTVFRMTIGEEQSIRIAPIDTYGYSITR